MAAIIQEEGLNGLTGPLFIFYLGTYENSWVGLLCEMGARRT